MKTYLFALVASGLMASVTAEPFDALWNVEGEQYRGKVASITNHQAYNNYRLVFNADGTVAELQGLGKDGKVGYRSVASYKDGKLATITRSQAGKSTPAYVETATYDTNGKLTKISRLAGGKETLVTSKVTQDRASLSFLVNWDGTPYQFDYAYAASGHWQTLKLINNGTPESINKVESRDKFGNPTKVLFLDPKGTVTATETYKYQYDDAGNWTERTQLVAYLNNGKLVPQGAASKATRKIEYR